MHSLPLSEEIVEKIHACEVPLITVVSGSVLKKFCTQETINIKQDATHLRSYSNIISQIKYWYLCISDKPGKILSVQRGTSKWNWKNVIELHATSEVQISILRSGLENYLF